MAKTMSVARIIANGEIFCFSIFLNLTTMANGIRTLKTESFVR